MTASRKKTPRKTKTAPGKKNGKPVVKLKARGAKAKRVQAKRVQAKRAKGGAGRAGAAKRGAAKAASLKVSSRAGNATAVASRTKGGSLSARPRYDRRHLNLGTLPTLESQDSLAQEITKRLREALSPTRILIQNESAKHAGHREKGRGPKGSHYRIMLVSEAFEGLSLLGRERWVQSLLEDLISAKRIHALATELKAPSEFIFENPSY